MKHIYHSICHEASGVWVAVTELTQRQSKCSRGKLLATSLLLCTTPTWALPTGDQLVAGQATVSIPNARVMQIDQTSPKAIINWQSFSINPNEAVNIQQPNVDAALLNRVVGQDASQIRGKINANGLVYLVNPNGILFNKTAQVDVGGLIATTHSIKDADFISGKNHFTPNGSKGTVENDGTINTSDGGVVALIGEKVNNTGNLKTKKGTTALAAGNTVDLDFKGNGLIEVSVSESTLNTQITNKGVIQADGGRVVMSAKAANQLIDTVINQEGVIQAQGLDNRNGEIVLAGNSVNQTGSLDVSGTTGGTVDIQANTIFDAGKTNANGSEGNGGKINMIASNSIVQTAASDTSANGKTNGGTIYLASTNSSYNSGKLSANGNQQGGTIDVLSTDRVVLATEAKVDASGKEQNGSININGRFQGENVEPLNETVSTLQQSTTFSQGYDKKLPPNDESIELIEVEKEGLTLAKGQQMHIEFPVNICVSMTSQP